ncbi:hypothetical protein PGT21_027211 [Puccinia graminis f. sp. tritici]|uniref:Uncharacterized protein n=1 Tax=Puccinia graminis f. sp. tritici TaxID=56615 RepID=A0A5B0NR70_PUCGR|nr:hypothetical protein PGTUg99_014417 [Puccinia graminis f. sp. tritici]KAA1091152.1 hypothetical protein PGT21_027211 [Puccinia graminis f. sp. tritici]
MGQKQGNSEPTSSSSSSSRRNNHLEMSVCLTRTLELELVMPTNSDSISKLEALELIFGMAQSNIPGKSQVLQ